MTLLAAETAKMIAPLLRSAAMSGESTLGASMAKFTSLPPVPRMSLASYQSFREKTAQYIGNFARSGLRPYCLSSSAARSSASGCFRNSSQTAGAPGGSGPADGARSKSPLQVTERSPRMFSVSSALSWPASGMPTRNPYLQLHARVRDRRLPCGRIRAEDLCTDRDSGKRSRPRPSWSDTDRRTRPDHPVDGGIGAPSLVRSSVQTPL